VPSIAKRSAPNFAQAAISGQSGQALVELALLLPFLILMLAGIIDLGRAYRALTLITSAASQGAQYAAFNPTDEAGIRARVNNALEGSGVAAVNPTGCPGICITYPSGAGAGRPIRVQVLHELTTILGSILGTGEIAIQGANEAVIFL
jgi:hypothetical protein